MDNIYDMGNCPADGKILASAALEEKILRIDIHFFNTQKEIERLIDSLKSYPSFSIRRRKKWF